MGIETNVKTLRKVPLLAVLSEAALERLANECNQKYFAPEEAIFLQGEPGNELFLVVKGAIRIALETLGGREVTVAIRREGSFVGEMALLDGHPRSASGYALNDCECLVLHKRSFDLLLDTEPQAARTLLLTLCQRLRQSSDRLEEVAVCTVRQRLASILAKLAMEEGDPDGTGVLLKSVVNYKMLTGLMCANRESVSRAASELVDEGLIERKGRRFRIINVDELRQAALE